MSPYGKNCSNVTSWRAASSTLWPLPSVVTVIDRPAQPTAQYQWTSTSSAATPASIKHYNALNSALTATSHSGSKIMRPIPVQSDSYESTATATIAAVLVTCPAIAGNLARADVRHPERRLQTLVPRTTPSNGDNTTPRHGPSSTNGIRTVRRF